MNWKSYEEIVKAIYEKLGKQNGVRVIGYGHDCKVLGKSGVEHQVDVLLEHSDGLHTYRTAVECKYWDKRRPKDDVTKLAEILEDAHIHKGVIVSKAGFTEDAKAFARYKNIELVELREPTEEDWQGRVKEIHVRIVCRMPETSDFHVFTVADGSDQIAMPPTLTDTQAVKVTEPGVEPKSLHAIMNEMISSANQDCEKAQILRRNFPPGTLAANLFGQGEVKIAALQFSLRFSILERTSIINGAEHVAMIMVSLFDERRFVISPEGDIRESQFRSGN